MMSLVRLLPLLILVLAASPAPAADVVYPTGSRIGLAPPAGLESSTNFYGFEDRTNNVGIIIATFPPDAYAELEKSITSENLKKQGIAFEGREAVAIADGKGFLIVGRQEVEKVKLRKWILVASLPGLTVLLTMQVPDAAKTLYPDAAIRAAMRTVAARPTVPIDEQLALLPFKVNELAGFGVAGVIPGRAVMLSDAKADSPGPPVASHMLITVAPGAPAQASEREAFAREAFAGIPNIKGTRLTGSETLRFAGHQGHQIFASAQEATTGTEINVVQWLRFGGGGYLQFVGVSRADAWRDAYPRFRSVRDGVDTR